MVQLTKKQIDNILNYVGRGFPMVVLPPENIEIEVITKNFEVLKTKWVNVGGKQKFENASKQNVLAWKHI